MTKRDKKISLAEERELTFAKKELDYERKSAKHQKKMDRKELHHERKSAKHQEELTRVRLIEDRARFVEDREWAQQLSMTNSWQEHQRHMQQMHGTNVLLPTSELTPCTAPNLLPKISTSAAAALAQVQTSSITTIAETNQQIELVKEQKELLYLQIKYLAQVTAEKKQRTTKSYRDGRFCFRGGR